MRSLQAPAAAGETLGADVLEKGYRQLAARYDSAHGGFLPEPKFPKPHHLMFLLRYWQRSGEPHALEMVETTLRGMRASALWDARGFGFHRYAGNADWSEPHYEKMLYDQAMLALAYLEAYQATRQGRVCEDGARHLHVRPARPARAGWRVLRRAGCRRALLHSERSREAAAAGRDEKIIDRLERPDDRRAGVRRGRSRRAEVRGRGEARGRNRRRKAAAFPRRPRIPRLGAAESLRSDVRRALAAISHRDRGTKPSLGSAMTADGSTSRRPMPRRCSFVRTRAATAPFRLATPCS